MGLRVVANVSRFSRLCDVHRTRVAASRRAQNLTDLGMEENTLALIGLVLPEAHWIGSNDSQ